MQAVLTVVLATQNRGKLTELMALFDGLPIELVSVVDLLNEPLSIQEDGATFEDNAKLKALAVSKAVGAVALADDSGLEVDALAGRPGVRSARFAHDRATDAENNAALLRELEDVAEGDRAARFRCVLALANPYDGSVRVTDGRCEGRIARTPRGSGGFGYDPLFVVDGHEGRAMAELSEDEKNEVSHRGRAAAAMRPVLLEVARSMLADAERITRE
jgi:XTP/dITP diphosphohydrolase